MSQQSFDNDEDHDETIEIEIQAQVIANLLLSNPQFVRAVAIAVRNMLLKMARPKGNLLGPWASSRPAPQSTNARRVQ